LIVDVVLGQVAVQTVAVAAAGAAIQIDDNFFLPLQLLTAHWHGNAAGLSRGEDLWYPAERPRRISTGIERNAPS
jgi:hypothetical protein